MTLTEVKRVMVVKNGGFEVMMEQCIGCDEDYDVHALHVCQMFDNISLGKREWQHMWTAF
jgi:hypothetical protein